MDSTVDTFWTLQFEACRLPSSSASVVASPLKDLTSDIDALTSIQQSPDHSTGPRP